MHRLSQKSLAVLISGSVAVKINKSRLGYNRTAITELKSFRTSLRGTKQSVFRMTV
jgi:hypothetical protein